MEFVDRKEEQKRLLKALNGEKPTFVVIYGRRRYRQAFVRTN